MGMRGLQISGNEQGFDTQATRGRTIAPAWHTVVLIAGILAMSIAGKLQVQGFHGRSHRLQTYATTACAELVMLGWVALGVRLRKVPFRSLFGTVEKGLRESCLTSGLRRRSGLGH